MAERPPATPSPAAATSAATMSAAAMSAAAASPAATRTPSARTEARIVVNGASRGVPTGQPLPELLAGLGLRPGSVIVELNGEALTASESTRVRLADGDTLEIVRAVAGG